MTDKFGLSTPASDQLFPQSEAVQLSRLGSILNGLEGGASAMRRHVQEAMQAVRAGTYRVDALQLSRCIVGEAMRPA